MKTSFEFWEQNTKYKILKSEIDVNLLICKTADKHFSKIRVSLELH